jgi:hypothetical protein
MQVRSYLSEVVHSTSRMEGLGDLMTLTYIISWEVNAGSSLARMVVTVSLSCFCLSAGSEAGLGRSTPDRMKVFSALRNLK